MPVTRLGLYPLIRGVRVLANNLMEIASELEQITSARDLWAGITKALHDEGISFVIYLTVGDRFQAPRLLATHDKIHNNIDPSTDPFLEHCCHSYEPTFTGAAFLPQYDYLPDTARAFIMEARAAGFESGLAIPVRLIGSSRFGGFNLGTGLSAEAFERRYTDVIAQLRTFCLLMHRRLEELQSSELVYQDGFRRMMVSRPQEGSEPLTPREREVLFLLTNGMSRKECARTCGISPHTVSDYTKSIYSKLNVHNVIEAARAAQML